MTKATCEESLPYIGEAQTRNFSIGRNFSINSVDIKPVMTSHNVTSCGFVIGDFGFFTDTGCITKHMQKAMQSLKAVLLESNHDIDMLINGPYPHYLKQWIISDKGHLSNIQASSLINDTGKNLSLALLGHLSGNNNTPDAAAKTFEALVKKRIDYAVCLREQETGSWKI
jgi:phosphoribosyl 1,2-cyclic phosphodiesterase